MEFNWNIYFYSGMIIFYLIITWYISTTFISKFNNNNFGDLKMFNKKVLYNFVLKLQLIKSLNNIRYYYIRFL